MDLSYALLFLPLLTGVLASVIRRYEHHAGGCKQQLALPVTRRKVFIAKYVLLIILVLVIQLLYLSSVYGVEGDKRIHSPFSNRDCLEKYLWWLGGNIAVSSLTIMDVHII